jgi:hypothetical protein
MKKSNYKAVFQLVFLLSTFVHLTFNVDVTFSTKKLNPMHQHTEEMTRYSVRRETKMKMMRNWGKKIRHVVWNSCYLKIIIFFHRFFFIFFLHSLNEQIKNLFETHFPIFFSLFVYTVHEYERNKINSSI